MPFFGSVDVCVLTVMRDELVKISKGEAKNEVKRCVHDKEVKAKVQCGFCAVVCQCWDGNEEISDNLRYMVCAVVCHVEAILSAECGGFEIESAYAFGTYDICLCAFIKHGGECVV